VSGVPFPILVEEDGTRLGTLVHVAETFGVTVKAAWNWAARRENNGFPEPVRRDVLMGRNVALYDLDEIRVWHLFYQPATGRPRPSISADNPDRGKPSAIAEALEVDVRRVYRWIERRRITKCPEPGTDGLYSISEWRTWYSRWQQRPAVQAEMAKRRRDDREPTRRSA
jgi:hypothetical protein